MARTPAGRALTDAHRQAQLQLRAGALRDFVELWPIWTGDEASYQRLMVAALPLVRDYNGRSAGTASDYFDAFRRAEKIPATARPVIAPPPPDSQILGTLHVTGIDMTRRAIAAGQSAQAAMRTGLTRNSGTVTRLVLAGGRDTVALSAEADRRCLGYARVTADNPCAFCAMVAGRGPVYSEDSVDFEAHDHCSCGAEPHYEGAEWPGRGREFHDLYVKHASGTANPVNELRRVLEGRA